MDVGPRVPPNTGAVVGPTVGPLLEECTGAADGLNVNTVGGELSSNGCDDGWALGRMPSRAVDACDVVKVGCTEGKADSPSTGSGTGPREGSVLGPTVGISLGDEVGKDDARAAGVAEAIDDGSAVG